MKKKTTSELLFEGYLNSHGLTRYDYEPNVEDKGTKVDYRLWHGDLPLFFEVKEFGRRAVEELSTGGAYDPHGPVHNKIEAALRNLGPYQEYCCSIVLYNAEAQLVHLTKEFLLGAMLGPVSILIPFDENGMLKDQEVLTFGEGGYMIDHFERRPRNTHVSAIIGMDDFPIGRYKFDIEYERRSRELGRRLTRDEILPFLEEKRGRGLDYGETTLRVLVCENPYADIPLPREVFTGPFDERYGPEGNHILRVFAGDAIRELEANEVYPGRSPISELFRKE